MINHMKNVSSQATVQQACFHCGLPVIEVEKYEVVINGEPQQMCCAGCQAVAQTILDNHLEDFYHYRDSDRAQRPSEIIPSALIKDDVYDRPNVRPRYVRAISKQLDEITLMLDGLTCAACAWLIEKQLGKQPGIESVEVNYSSMLAKVKWQHELIELSQILKCIRDIGYLATPYEPRIQYKQLLSQQTQQIKRIGITAALGMQVMIISVALYFGHFYGMDDDWKLLFQRLGLLLILPIFFYSAQPFFKASITQLRNFQPGMDVPVCLGLSLAFIASVWTIISGQGEVYFDSITMFVFLLLVARYFMHNSLLTASHSIERLAANTPLSAPRLIEHSISSMAESVTAEELKPGDWIRVLAGHVIPADGIVINGNSTVNQAVISGESKPIKVSENSEVIAGSVNNNSPLIIKVTASGENTVFSAIERLAKQSLATQSADLPLIDYIARWFVVVVLLIATTVAVYWWNTNPQLWLTVTIAVLVISCPCALSLSVPTAHASTNSKLIAQGLLATTTEAVEKLAKVDHILLDKTGTLTHDNLHLQWVKTTTDLTEAEVLRLAASMEVNSDHVLAKSILDKNQQALYQLSDWQYFPGFGVSATINSNQYFLGSAELISKNTGIDPDQNESDTVIFLADSNELLAEFYFSHSLREGVIDLIDYLKQLGLPTLMLTGDSHGPAKELARQLGIEKFYSDCKPQDKLNIVKDLQQQSTKVLMIGDGINDSPVLAAADVSIAVAGATPSAVSGADIVMVNPSLAVLRDLHQTAIKTTKIIRQNISWAIGYNLLAIPFAASGFINPLFAAIGMSISSIIVVLNAQRLRR